MASAVTAEVFSHLDSGPFSVSLNGTAPERQDTPLPFYPGRRSTLEVRSAREAPDAQVRLKATAPDRRTFTRTRRLPSGSTVELDLGPLLVPAVYEFEAGVCYRRGYRFTITIHDPDSGTPLARCDLSQCCTGDEHAEWLRFGDHERVVYDTGWVPPGRHWIPFSEMSRSMQPAVDLRLGPRVLLDRNSVELRFRLRPGLAGVDELRARLAVRRRGAPRSVESGMLAIGPQWATRKVDVSAWEPGTYWFELLPELDGRRYAQGPRLRYRRPPADADGVLVSPLAPFRLRRDRSRDPVEIDDWEPVAAGSSWRVEGTGPDSCLVSGEKGSSVTLQPGLRGCYAVFVQPVGCLYVQAGDGLIRLMQGERDGSAPASSMLALGAEFGPVFVCVREFSGEAIELRAEHLPRAGIRDAARDPGHRGVGALLSRSDHAPPHRAARHRRLVGLLRRAFQNGARSDRDDPRRATRGRHDQPELGDRPLVPALPLAPAAGGPVPGGAPDGRDPCRLPALRGVEPHGPRSRHVRVRAGAAAVATG